MVVKGRTSLINPKYRISHKEAIKMDCMMLRLHLKRPGYRAGYLDGDKRPDYGVGYFG